MIVWAVVIAVVAVHVFAFALCRAAARGDKLIRAARADESREIRAPR